MFNWFGPSKFDQMFALLREERAAQTALVSELVAASRAQTELATKQFALLTAPTEAPRVRLMTPDIEADYERQRKATVGSANATPKPATTILPDTLLAELSREFATESATYD